MSGRLRRRIVPVALIALSLVGVACGAPASDGAPGPDRDLVAQSTPTTVPTVAGSLIAELAPELPSAVYDPARHRAPASEPARLRIDDLGIDGAAVVPVGVEPNGEMEVPAADQVGWYRYGPRPGQAGPTVLAAHIAYDGRDGVFRRLTSLRPGAVIAVAMDDGEEVRYRAVDVQQHAKTALPSDVFGAAEDERLVLITCGGIFDPVARSYDSNVIVYADRIA